MKHFFGDTWSQAHIVAAKPSDYLGLAFSIDQAWEEKTSVATATESKGGRAGPTPKYPPGRQLADAQMDEPDLVGNTRISLKHC
jgi:hypothetical protein